jgi:hypothetical protein
MRRSIAIVILLAAALIGGCSKPTHADREPEISDGILPVYQQQALEKAHGMEKVINDAAEQHRQDMDRQDQVIAIE